MKVLYLDCFSGISGDMLMGALCDLGVRPEVFRKELAKLKVCGMRLEFRRETVSGIRGVKFECLVKPAGPGHRHGHGKSDPGHGRTFSDIRRMIERSKLSAFVRRRAVAVFSRLAAAEGKIHGRRPDRVHFHEVGAVDSIADIVGVCVGLEALGVEKVFASELVDGRGFTDTEHGRFPAPAPATLEILKGVAYSQCEEPFEMITPTGAAVLAEFADSFGPMRNLTISRIGHGLGTRRFESRPNVLRAILGAMPASGDANFPELETDRVEVLETNLDDASPEVLGDLVDRALLRGALDVFFTPVYMKKNRPGTVVSLLVPESRSRDFALWLMEQTSAFGVRAVGARRWKLPREIIRVRTRFGPVAVKVGRAGGRVVAFSPEYESCRQAAARAGVPVQRVYQAALKHRP